ncbi:MAG: hypothetical protein PSV22_03390 [Pseudolabrys sp.]|nr:hypothetical protein [Pseudolabrys sp.]
MIDKTTFKPNRVYVTTIAASFERVWQALTSPTDARPSGGGAGRLSVPVAPPEAA